jgi:hypothetical protein
MNRNDIIDHVGAASWSNVMDEFGSMTLEEIKAELDYMWPHEDNDELAEAIYNELNQ